METSAVRNPSASAPQSRTAPQSSMAGEDGGVSPSASLDNSLNRRRNTYAALPSLAPSKPLSPNALGANNQPRYTNTARRSTAPGIDWHTPPASTTTSLEKASMATHASSEPRHTTASRLALTTLPPVAGANGAPSSLSARAVSAGMERSNAAITRSARLPLGLNVSPTPSTASTPPARQPPTTWATGAAEKLSGAANARTPSTSPAPSSPATSSGKAAVPTERVKLTNGGSDGRAASGATTTTLSPSSSISAADRAAAATPPQVREINTALKTFNQRVLEEQERERARSGRRSSHMNSRETSMSALAVPSTRPPSVGPSPSSKATTPAPTEQLVKRSPLDGATASRPSALAVRAQPAAVTGPSPATTPPASAAASSSLRAPMGTGPKSTPAGSSPTPSSITSKSPSGPISTSPARTLRLSPGKPNLALTVDVSSSSTDSAAKNTSSASTGWSGPRSAQQSAESAGASGAARMSLVEQGPRSNLPRTLPTPSTQSPPPQSHVKTSVQTSPPSQLGGTPNSPAAIKAAITSTPTATTSTSSSQPTRLALCKSPQRQTLLAPSSNGVASTNAASASAAAAVKASPATASTKKAPPPPPTAVSLPSRYSDYGDEASNTPPRSIVPTPALASPVYSAVEVQAPTPPTSTTASSRRAGASGAGGCGDASQAGSGRAQSNGRPASQAPQSTSPRGPVSGLVKSHTLDDLDDAGEDEATSVVMNTGGANTGGSARATAFSKAPQGRVGDTASLDSGAGGGGATNGNQSRPLAVKPPARDATAKPNNVPAPAGPTKASSPHTPSSLPLTALAVFGSTDEKRTAHGGSVTPTKTTAVPPLQSSPAAPTSTTKPVAVASKTTPPSPVPVPSAVGTASVPSIANHHRANINITNNNNTVAKANIPPSSAVSLLPARDGASARPVPAMATSPPSLISASRHASPSQQQQQRPGSALRRNGRYATSRSRDGPGPLGSESDANESAGSNSPAAGADVEAEAATLHTYLQEEELNLSMSTFNSVGLTLAHSLNLRVLNLKGSTIASEGLRGLANIPTLRSICVSHMRNLTTLLPLVTPTTAGARCAIEEVDAQFSSISNDGIKGLERVRRLRRLDLSMTPVSDVTCLASSISLYDLYLTGTRVDNAGVAGLERVPTLVTLNIARTKVTSVCQLAKSRSLQTFVLYSCQVNDAGFIGVAEMPRLATLDVSTTKIEDLSVLQRSRSLRSVKAQWLSLKNCQDIIQERRSQMDAPAVGDSMEWRDTEAGFAGLAAIVTLETLDLSFNTLRSVHSLCRSKSLKHLFLKRTRVDNGGIGSIAQLAPTLETLVITNLTDSLDDEDDEHEFETTASGLLSLIGDIHLLLHLTLLDLSYTDVFDLRLLQNIHTLKELVIVETLVTVDGLRGIETIPSLEVLDLSQTSILSLQFLVGGAPALKRILARSNRNTSGFVLGQIHKLPALEHLDLSDSVVEDMENVPKKLWRLKELVWRWGERRDNKGLAPPLECWVTSPRLAGLSEMPCLTLLDLTSSRVHELTFLTLAPRLTTVYLKLCKLLRNNTIQELGTLAALEVLQLSENAHITDVTFLRSCRKLRELQVNNTRVNTKGLEGVTHLPELKVLNITNTRAEDEAMHGGQASDRHRMLEDSTMRDGSAVLENTVTPAQFRVPRRRRVSFVADDNGDTIPKAP